MKSSEAFKYGKVIGLGINKAKVELEHRAERKEQKLKEQLAQEAESLLERGVKFTAPAINNMK